MKWIHWFHLSLLIVIFSIGIGYSLIKKSALKKCHLEHQGIIVDKYRKKNRGWFIHYQYYIEGKQYKSSQTIRNRSDVEGLSIGDTILIYYSCDYPSISVYNDSK